MKNRLILCLLILITIPAFGHNIDTNRLIRENESILKSQISTDQKIDQITSKLNEVKYILSPFEYKQIIRPLEGLLLEKPESFVTGSNIFLYFCKMNLKELQTIMR